MFGVNRILRGETRVVASLSPCRCQTPGRSSCPCSRGLLDCHELRRLRATHPGRGLRTGDFSSASWKESACALGPTSSAPSTVAPLGRASVPAEAPGNAAARATRCCAKSCARCRANLSVSMQAPAAERAATQAASRGLPCSRQAYPETGYEAVKRNAPRWMLEIHHRMTKAACASNGRHGECGRYGQPERVPDSSSAARRQGVTEQPSASRDL